VLERGADATVQPPQLVPVEAGGGTKRIESRPPKRFVDIDVSHPRERALVEEGSLQRRATACEPLTEPCSREERVERLVSHSRGEVRLRLTGLEQEPGSEAPHVPVRDIRSVV
jgi:hypothetical protein